MMRAVFMYYYGVFVDLLLNFSPKKIWGCQGNIFGVTSERERMAATGDATKHPTKYRATPSQCIYIHIYKIIQV